ncbi:MAG: phosphoribosylanthranilate isomerase [Bacteroidetes bacterium]|nr:phosphoribosylanthranilate isomerase [Bacteroidota bacterium]
MKVKICGMRDPTNILEVASLAPDFMGFIFYEKSKRYVGKDFKIPELFPSVIKKIGVFVNQSIDEIALLAKKHSLDYAQLHGNESADFCFKLKNKIKVIKAFLIDESFDFSETEKYCSVDYFLFDSKSTDYGGSGKTFDWNLLHKFHGNTPFFLSGGLSVENLTDLKKIPNANFYAIDINSKAESVPVLKDMNILHSMFKTLNNNS